MLQVAIEAVVQSSAVQLRLCQQLSVLQCEKGTSSELKRAWNLRFKKRPTELARTVAMNEFAK